MRLSPVGEKLIKSSEELRLKAYLDDAGVSTIGYGHTKGVHMDMTCTEEEAEQWFWQDVAPVEEAVNRLVKAPLNQNQFDALGSFTFNEGISALTGSTLLRRLNDADYTAAALEFPKWNKIHKNGQLVVEPGLVTRRHNEQTLFNS